MVANVAAMGKNGLHSIAGAGQCLGRFFAKRVNVLTTSVQSSVAWGAKKSEILLRAIHAHAHRVLKVVGLIFSKLVQQVKSHPKLAAAVVIIGFIAISLIALGIFLGVKGKNKAESSSTTNSSSTTV